MRPTGLATILLVSTALLLSACSRDKQPILMNTGSSDGTPDEFAILPNKPIEIPEDLKALPAPTPGGANRVDPTPEADAIAALGGKPDRINQSGIPSSDGGLVNYTSRFGVSSGIRETLAAEDLDFRRDNNGRILERLFNVNVYFKAYRGQSLDQHAELLRWRSAGVRTPAAPPEKE